MSNFADESFIVHKSLRMRIAIAMLMFFFFTTSFQPQTDIEVEAKYTLSVEAKGCHYQININGEKLDEGKTYQKVEKIFVLNKQLTEDDEQVLNINMMRISREMPLNATKAFLNLKLEKTENDSIVYTKEVKLPTFPYDDDDEQPASIGGSIRFEK